MPLIVKDRVQQTSTTTGTGTLTLSGTVSGFQTFSSAIGNTNTTYYAIVNNAEWEVGIGTVSAGALSRDTVLESSNGGSLVNFTAGTKSVFCTYPAEKSVYKDETDKVSGYIIDNSSIGATTPSTGGFTTGSFSGVTSFAAGSVSAPSITRTGDTNTGIFFPSADTIAFTEGGTEAMRINSSGNVGIGTNSPVVRLQVQGDVSIINTTATALSLAGGTSNFNISATQSDYAVFTAGGSGLGFAVSYGSGLLVCENATSRIGVGTTTPDATLTIDGVTSFADGSASAPSITNIGDLNTGIFFPAADTVAVATNGVEALRVDSSGNLLVGTTSAFRKINIGGTSNAHQSFSATSFRRYTIGSESNGFVVFDDTAGLYRTVIDASGNVGIGTASPTARLDIAPATGAPQIFIRGIGSSDVCVKTVTALGAYSFGTGVGSPTNCWNVYDNNVSLERMRIDSAGNVGIGVTPSAWGANYKVIESNGNAAAMFAASSINGVQLSSNTFHNGTSWTYKTTGEASRYAVNTGQHVWFSAASGTANTAITWTTAMILNSSGNLGIGTTSPSNTAGYATLSINGSTGGQIAFQTGTAPFQFIYSSSTNLTYFNAYGSQIWFTGTAGSASERMRIHASGGVSIGNTTDRGAASLNVSGLIYPQQAATAPTYVKGAIYFDTTLNKLRVGGATAWETITSV